MTDANAARFGALIDHIRTYLGQMSGPGIEEATLGYERWSKGAAMPLQPRRNAVVETNIETALNAMQGHSDLRDTIAAIWRELPWITYELYDPLMIGDGFARGHAYAKLVGRSAPIAAEDFEAGLFVIAPHVFYRDHQHAARELYMPLTGPNGWRFAPDAPLQWVEAHHPVWNEPFRCHATKVGATPFLCIYIWTADVEHAATVVPAKDWAVVEALR